MSTASLVMRSNTLDATRHSFGHSASFVGDALYAALCGVVVVQLSPAITNHRRMQSYFGVVPSVTAVAEGEYLGCGVAGSLGKQ